MFVIPSIDILNGKCVQLVNGRIETATIYGSPKEYYNKWIEKGADKLSGQFVSATQGCSVRLATVSNHRERLEDCQRRKGTLQEDRNLHPSSKRNGEVFN